MTRRYLVTGRVQGVGYRYFVQRAARELGLDGWVRNLADGQVECRARGPRAVLDELEARLRRGPPLAVVRSVKTEDEADGDTIEGFHIR